ncbi:hypothetical protein BDZ94DRAFT_1189835 [Collybia nuda]|uniref:Alpha-ketoglutarate-dependent dioxygenase AlkB-like domain-containing protein n=1 Tax=Collybia nuda TaxID=64659 RepID=A0A9P5Y9W1_9AGAR|nr:hypothetical protein BDZ94DRAFT_1189835 [Collybia nuda]
MRQPTSWDDPNLLQDEPFRSVFHTCKEIMGLGHETKPDVIRALDALAKGFQIVPGKEVVALAWLGLAYPYKDFSTHASGNKRWQNENDFRSFVEFYWRISQGNEPYTYLSHQRKKRGYKEDLPAPLPKEVSKVNAKKIPNGSPTSAVFTSKHTGQTFEQNISLLGFQGHFQMALKSCGEISSMEVQGEAKKKKKKKINTPAKISQYRRCIDYNLPQPPDHLDPMVDTAHRSIIPTATEISSTPRLDTGLQGGKPSLNIYGLDHFQKSRTTAIQHDLGGKLSLTRSPSINIVNSNAMVYEDRSSPAINNPIPVPNGKISGIPVTGLAGTNTCTPQGVSSHPNICQLPETSPFTGPNPGDYSDIVDIELGAIDVNLTVSKPPLPILPPIWAQSRQEVCESFDWFRSYQSGVYFCNNIVKGYLLSAFSSCRDVFEHGGKLIISHGGGGAESVHQRHGQIINEAAADQDAQDKSVRALLQNYKDARPLVLLIDDKYVLFPYDLGSRNVTYAVLGFYTIAHAWAEYQPANNLEGRVVRYKFAFEWCQGQGEPWWLQKMEGESGNNLARPLQYHPRDLSFLGGKKLPVKVAEQKLFKFVQPKPEDLYLTCEKCREQTPRIYRQQWICLNRMCTRFWVTLNGTAPTPLLDYNTNFLHLSCSFVLPTSLADIRPLSPTPSANDITTTHAFTRGWHCRNCGRLSCRYKWEEWECSNCKRTTRIVGRLHTPSDFWSLNFPATTYRDHLIARNSGIVQEPMKTFSLAKGMGQTQTFVLPDGKGQIHHIQSGTWNSEEVDEIFRDYQEQAAAGKLLFRRWPLRSHKCRGPLLTNYFSQNSGEPYQYVGGTANTVPFSKAPGAVVQAREFIQTRIHQALGIDLTFNEVLSAAYMEGQKMAFHSDAEPGLGPLVAGLSLGSSAFIHFRPRSTPKARPVAISFVLRHGDVLVMDGAEVQQYYEHTVVPTNFRIAATARNIYPSHV